MDKAYLLEYLKARANYGASHSKALMLTKEQIEYLMSLVDRDMAGEK